MNEVRNERGETVASVIKMIVKELVDKPEDVSLIVITGEQTTLIELRAARIDLGKIIGKKGKTANSLRTLVTAISAKLKFRAVLEIIMEDN